MNARIFFNHLSGALFAIVILLLAACQPAAIVTDLQPTLPPAQPSATAVISATQVPAQPTATAVILPTRTPATADNGFTLDLSGVAQKATIETVSMPTFSWWEDAPLYRRATLQGYPVTDHGYKPRIYIYPAADLVSASVDAANIADHLQALLQTQKTGDKLPFLPLITDVQVMHAQVQYLDFKSGKGVRFLTQYNNGMAPVNNHDLIYTFQGLTSDGKYYIAAVLPLTNPDLPADSLSGGNVGAGKNYLNYVANTVTLLNGQPASRFTPDLAKLDALIQSIEVK